MKKSTESLVSLEMLYLEEKLEEKDTAYLLLHYGQWITLCKSWDRTKIINAILAHEEKRSRLDVVFNAVDNK